MTPPPPTSPGRAGELTLVTGATGFLGAALVGRLLADGAQVRFLARSPATAARLAEQGAEPVVGEIEDSAALADALRGVATVYHLAGRLLVPGVRREEYRRTHVRGTSLLIAAARREPGLRRLVHCSTTGVLGVTGDHPADESAPLRPTNIYEATKAEAESAVRSEIHAGLPAVIARPGLVYGPGDLHLLGFFRAVLGQRFWPIGRRPIWLHPIYIDDMVDALLLCGRSPLAVGECFNIAGPQPVSLVGLAASIARAGGTTLPAGRIPLPAARAVATFGDLLPPRLRRAAPLTRGRLDFLTHSRVYDIAKSGRLLGFVPQTDLSTGVVRSLAWYREQGYLATAPARLRVGT